MHHWISRRQCFTTEIYRLDEPETRVCRPAHLMSALGHKRKNRSRFAVVRFTPVSRYPVGYRSDWCHLPRCRTAGYLAVTLSCLCSSRQAFRPQAQALPALIGTPVADIDGRVLGIIHLAGPEKPLRASHTRVKKLGVRAAPCRALGA